MPEYHKCQNYEQCRGHVLNGDKFCDACKIAGFGKPPISIDLHAENRREYEHKQKHKKGNGR